MTKSKTLNYDGRLCAKYRTNRDGQLTILAKNSYLNISFLTNNKSPLAGVTFRRNEMYKIKTLSA